MAHSLCRIWVHSIFGTKYRHNLIHPSIEAQVHALINQELEGQKCRVRVINGTPNHVHALFLLDKTKCVADVMKTTKGVISHEINQLGLIPERYAWQVGYGAFSVSENRVPVVEQYIRDQKIHHQTETLEEELRRFWAIYGLEWIEGNPDVR